MTPDLVFFRFGVPFLFFFFIVFSAGKAAAMDTWHFDRPGW
jgi:hypothetical protein